MKNGRGFNWASATIWTHQVLSISGKRRRDTLWNICQEDLIAGDKHVDIVQIRARTRRR